MVRILIENSLGYPGLFLACAGSGIFVPVPEDVPLLYAGTRIASGMWSWPVTLMVAWVGVGARDVTSWAVGRFLGKWLLDTGRARWLLGGRRIERADRGVGEPRAGADGVRAHRDRGRRGRLGPREEARGDGRVDQVHRPLPQQRDQEGVDHPDEVPDRGPGDLWWPTTGEHAVELAGLEADRAVGVDDTFGVTGGARGESDDRRRIRVDRRRRGEGLSIQQWGERLGPLRQRVGGGISGWVDQQLMNFSMRDDGLKAQLFRFVDVLPVLHQSDSINRHLKEYMGLAGEGLPEVARELLRFLPDSGVIGSTMQEYRTFIEKERASQVALIHAMNFKIAE